MKKATLPPIGGTDQGVIARFVGLPFGTTLSGKGRWPEMGLSGSFIETPVALTTFSEAPITVNYFEREASDDALWPLKDQFAPDVRGFLDAVGSRWQADDRVAEDSEARVEVERMCAEARRLIEAGDYAQDGELLNRAVQRNAVARSPLVFQYIANLGVLAGDLFTAVAAQKEALRLAPDNQLYRSNLRSLLTVSHKEGTKPRTGGEGPTGQGYNP